MNDQDKYGKLYSEICDGFSIQEIDQTIIYFKHLSINEYFNSVKCYDKYLQEALAIGLFKEADKIKDAIDGNWWSSENESRIDFLKITLRNLAKTKDKLLYTSQKEEIQKQIDKNNYILLSYTKDRREIVGYTAEDYAESRSNEDLIKNHVFKDSSFTQKLFEDSSIEGEDVIDLQKIKDKFYIINDNLSEKRIQCLAATGFFQNLIFISSDPMDFWGAPLFKCTRYQSNLLLYGKMYRNFIKNRAEIGKAIPDEILSEPEKFVSFIDGQQNGKQGSIKKNRDANNNVSSYVGATNNDLKDMGVKIEKIKGKSLLQLAKENGGIIEKNDYLSAREGG